MEELLRVKVPKELVEELGRKEIWRSLETGNHRKAVIPRSADNDP